MIPLPVSARESQTLPAIDRDVNELRAVEAHAEGKDQPSYATLRFGIDFNQFVADWFERQALAFEEGVPLAKLPSPEEAG